MSQANGCSSTVFTIDDAQASLARATGVLNCLQRACSGQIDPPEPVSIVDALDVVLDLLKRIDGSLEQTAKSIAAAKVAERAAKAAAADGRSLQ